MVTVEPTGRFLTIRRCSWVMPCLVEKRNASSGLIALRVAAGPAAIVWTTLVTAGAGAAAARRTMISKLLLTLLPAASVALQVTLVVPRANSEPEAGVQASAGLASTVSVAVAA